MHVRATARDEDDQNDDSYVEGDDEQGNDGDDDDAVTTATGKKKVYPDITNHMMMVVDDESARGYFAGGKKVLVVTNTLQIFDPVGSVKSRRFMVTGKCGIATADGRTITEDTMTDIRNCTIHDYDTVVELMTKIVRSTRMAAETLGRKDDDYFEHKHQFDASSKDDRPMTPTSFGLSCHTLA